MKLDIQQPRANAIETKHLFDMFVDLYDPLRMGGECGKRVLFSAAGGRFHGPQLRGEVLAGGGDWAVFRPDGSMTLDVRLTLRTHDAALLYLTYGGRWTYPQGLRSDMADPARRHLIDPAKYYFRTNPLFETGARQYRWLNDIVCIGSGHPIEGGVAYSIFEVL